VQSVERTSQGVTVTTAEGGSEAYDCVFVACHSDQALAILADPTAEEEAVLGAIRYQPNQAVLHTDISVLPKRRRAWSSWNYRVPVDRRDHVAVSYNMNILQGLQAEQTYIVTLNDDRHIDPAHIIRRVEYQHPVYTLDTIVAQQRQHEVNCDRTYYCGAYWRNGFHEDGVVSALNAVSHFEEKLERAELHLRRAG
jgi:predicted NAD/FAD-binding protein